MRAAALPKLLGTGRRTDRHRQEYTHTRTYAWLAGQTRKHTGRQTAKLWGLSMIVNSFTDLYTARIPSLNANDMMQVGACTHTHTRTHARTHTLHISIFVLYII